MRIGIPKKVVHDLELEADDYVHLYCDEYNDQLIVRKVPDLEEVQK
jgi:bifunctional DNA-binding transcriptional regulator/antitoxin component of YhaV-PrlF toxin-antitoxin module